MRIILVLLGAVGWAQPFSRGAEANTAPAPPYVAPVRVPSEWTVAYQPTKAQAADFSPRLVFEEYAYNSDLRRKSSVSSDGKRAEEWLAKGILLSRENGGLYLLDPHFQPFTTSLSGTTLVEFDWLSVANFTGTEKVGGVECNVFRDGGKTAAIDAATKLPVQLTVDGVVRTYAFKDSQASLALPPDLAARLAGYERQLKGMTINRPPR